MNPDCARRSQVDAYFAGRLPGGRQSELRLHLDDCPVCRAQFDRQLQLAALDPAALPLDERVGRALGVRSAGIFRGLSPVRMAFIGVLAVSAVVLVARPGPRATDGFQARGVGDMGATEQMPRSTALVFSLGAPATDVLAFRTEGGAAGLQTGRLPATAELAFAYRNGGGWPWLMVFARDELGHVYWYQPPWTDGRDDPQAVPLSERPGLHELPQAVSHSFEGQRLTLCALVSQQPLSVKQIDRQLRAAPGRPPGELLAQPGRESACRELEAIR